MEETGARRILENNGGLQGLTHKATLDALEHRAIRYSTKQQSQHQLDLALVNAARTNLEIRNQSTPHSTSLLQDDTDITSYVTNNSTLLSPIGICPGKKREGITRIMYENLNGIPARVTGNGKLHKAMEIIDEMEVDVFAFNEHKINFKHRDNRKAGLGTILNGGETLTRAVGGNFKHPIAKTLGKRMEGGTGMVACGELASLLRAELSGMDSTGLARCPS